VERVFDSVGEDPDVAVAVAVAGDPESDAPVVGADRDSERYVKGERHIGEFEHAPLAEVERVLRAGNVGGDGLYLPLGYAGESAGTEGEQRRWAVPRELGELDAGERLPRALAVV